MSLIILSIIFLLIILLIIYLKLKLTSGWCYSPVCLIGKTAIVTGSNTGIGYETALDFAKRGARVILACRNEKKANEARTKIIDSTNNPNVIVQIVDFSSFDSVKDFVKRIYETEDRLDILVNNAGLAGMGNKLSKEGLLLLLKINYFSSCLLTLLLLDLLRKSTSSRIINVSSTGAKYAKLNVDNLNHYDNPYIMYFNSKLCNILFTQVLAKKLQGTGISVFSLHPGVVRTNIFRRLDGIYKLFIKDLIGLIFFKNCMEGAQTIIFTSIEKNIEIFSGEHFTDCKVVEPYKTAKNYEVAKKLWYKTMEILNLKDEHLGLI